MKADIVHEAPTAIRGKITKTLRDSGAEFLDDSLLQVADAIADIFADTDQRLELVSAQLQSARYMYDQAIKKFAARESALEAEVKELKETVKKMFASF